MGALSQDCSACNGIGFTKPGMGVNVYGPGMGMGMGAGYAPGMRPNMAGPGYGMPGSIPPSGYGPHGGYGYGPHGYRY